MSLLKNKKFIVSTLGVVVAVLASVGIEVSPETQELILSILGAIFGGGAAGYTAGVKNTKKKLDFAVNNANNTLKLAANGLNNRLDHISAEATTQFGDNVSAFVEAKLDPIKRDLETVAGIEIKL